MALIFQEPQLVLAGHSVQWTHLLEDYSQGVSAPVLPMETP